ncbi:MAG: DEAD/DEAH box helicase [Proteobacteria bacterium]|nr:DEAD/DEAH box helicase [Pseudomonadota bacterium]
MDAVQFELLARLRMHTTSIGYSTTDTFKLTGDRADALLTDLLATQTCFWGNPRDGQLEHGPSLPLGWHWQLRDDGSQTLLPDLPAGATLLRAGGLWYVDPAQHRIGRIEHDADLAQRLLRMPTLLPEHVAHVLTQWHTDPALAAVPVPLEPVPPRVLAGPPQPVVCLTPLAQPSIPTRRQIHLPKWLRADPIVAFVARLAFDYGDQRVAPARLPGEESRMVDGQRVLIRRDATAEHATGQRLQAVGLIPATHHPTAHWPIAALVTAADWLPVNTLAADDPNALLALVPALTAAGFRIEYAPDFPLELTGAPEDWYGQVDENSGIDWFGVELGVVLGGERVSLLPILTRAIEDHRFPLVAAPDETADAVWLAPLDERRRMPLPVARVRELLAPLLEWLTPNADRVKVPRLALDVLADLQERSGEQFAFAGMGSAQALGERLRNAGRDLQIAAPTDLRGTPRPYQLDGLRWLRFLADAQIGGVLADDMGLGKTLQILMHLLDEKARGKLAQPALVVCPTSVLGNWSAQAANFAPSLSVLVLHGGGRASDFKRIDTHDVIVTSYALLVRDRAELGRRRFALAVFDEAQAIKNPLSQASQVARTLPAQRRLAVTGTPLENHLGELWSQFDCVLPGLLGQRDHFARHFRTPIEKHADAERQARLNRRIAPYMLRRSKEAVAPELPPKTLIERKIELSGAQRELYETLRLAMHDRVRQALGKRGLAQSSIVILDALLKLRQVCCDPRLVKLDGRRRGEPPPSAKLAELRQMLGELLDEGRRVLLFSQFTGMLDLIEADLHRHGTPFVRLDGSTVDRQTPIQRFQSGAVPLFLISLKAGGVGLNLTAADTVIHYDPWWNPAVENQATDRAHRIGQDKPVFVYKLVCADTVEDKILQLQQRKAGLAQAILEGGTRASLKFDESDLDALFAPLS